MNKKIVEIKCLPRLDFTGGMMFWCPFCNKWHLHGKGNGHRVSHCFDENSPLYQKGYIIKMMTPKELRETKKAIEQYQGETK